MARQAGNDNSIRTRRGLFCAAVALLAVAHASTARAYVPDDRWAVTASGATGAAGTPMTLTWSLAPDGTQIPSEGASNLVSYFDGLFNVTSGGSDLTQRPWFPLFQQSFDRWSQLGGITFVYEPHDDSAILNYNAGVLGVRGDVRIGGAFVDGANGTLAYTWLPDSGDMVIDSGESGFYANAANNYRGLRNTVMHELGHAFGLLHIESSTDQLLMEPFINNSFDGPQLDDIRGIQGLYGDAIEKTNGGLGNGTAARAFHLGSLAPQNPLDVGSDATGSQVVAATETDFVSIANSTDLDFYSFTIDAPSLLDVSLTPLGGVFNQGTEGGVQSQFNANARSDLALTVIGPNGTTILGSANRDGGGAIETIADLALEAAGKYYVRVTGASANVQLYQLQLTSTLIALLAGDYNSDGIVDAFDYSIWRDSLGQTGTGLAADGSGNGIIDSDDYDVWKNNFGAAAGSGGFASGTVPEPNALVLLLIGVATGARIRVRRG